MAKLKLSNWLVNFNERSKSLNLEWVNPRKPNDSGWVKKSVESFALLRSSHNLWLITLSLGAVEQGIYAGHLKFEDNLCDFSFVISIEMDNDLVNDSYLPRFWYRTFSIIGGVVDQTITFGFG